MNSTTLVNGHRKPRDWRRLARLIIQEHTARERLEAIRKKKDAETDRFGASYGCQLTPGYGQVTLFWARSLAELSAACDMSLANITQGNPTRIQAPLSDWTKHRDNPIWLEYVYKEEKS